MLNPSGTREGKHEENEWIDEWYIIGHTKHRGGLPRGRVWHHHRCTNQTSTLAWYNHRWTNRSSKRWIRKELPDTRAHDTVQDTHITKTEALAQTGRVLHFDFGVSGSRISHLPVNVSLPFSLPCCLIGVLPCNTLARRGHTREGLHFFVVAVFAISGPQRRTTLKAIMIPCTWILNFNGNNMSNLIDLVTG